jgi:hypothetical protein
MTNEEAINELKEASDSEVRYGDIKHHHDEVMKRVVAFDMAIKALQAQSCEDCISRQAVHEMLENIPVNESDKWFNWLQKACIRLAELPSVTPTRSTGRWIDIQYFKNDDTYYRPKCPFCSIEPKEYSNYCPNCGAKMEVTENADSN